VPVNIMNDPVCPPPVEAKHSFISVICALCAAVLLLPRVCLAPGFSYHIQEEKVMEHWQQRTETK